MNRFVFIVASLMLFQACSPSIVPPPAPDAPAESAAPAPTAKAGVTKVTADDVKAQLEAAKGKVVVVNLWATWCPPCVKEMPELAKLVEQYKGKPLEFISVSADAVDTIEKVVIPFHEKHALPFPVGVMNGQDMDAFSQALGKELSGALPETLVYGKDGKLVKAIESETDFAELDAIIAPLI